MKIKEGFKKRQLGRDFIVCADGISQVNFNKMIVLNATAAYLWDEIIGREFSVGDLARLLAERYEVDEATALADSAALVEKWNGIGILQMDED